MVINSKMFKNLFGCSMTALCLSACATPQQSQPPQFLKNPIQITESVERMELYSRPDGMTLSARDQDALGEFLAEYGRYAEGPLYVNVPNRSTAGISQTQSIVEGMMGQLGLRGAPVEQGQYQVRHNMPAPVVLSYRRLKAISHDCSLTTGVHGTYNNQTYDTFGCSQSANLAAMIEDPRQLVHPHAFAPSDMRRRMTVYDKYIKGESPASDQPDRQEVSSSDN